MRVSFSWAFNRVGRGMPSQISSEATQAFTKRDSASRNISSSLKELVTATFKHKANADHQQYVPPSGSQNIPHPRTIPDILLRCLVIQLCAALAYALFLHTLRQILRRKRRRVTDLPGPRWLWPLLSVLIPELVLVQISLWVICGLCPSVAEILGIERPQEPRTRASRRTTQQSQDTSSWMLLQAIALVVPLYYASKAYEQRLLMKFHEASYVANTGLDHRNGWAVISGLVCCTATVLLSALLRIKGTRATEEPSTSHSGASKHLEAIAEEEEEETWDGGALSPQFNHAKRKDSFTANRGPQNRINGSTAPSRSSQHSQMSLTALIHDPEAVLTLVLSSVIHQAPLAATNRLPPLTALLTTKWCLSLIPITLFGALTLPPAQRLALRRALLSSSKSDKMIVIFTLLRTMVVIIPWLLLVSTIVLQIWSDMAELQSLKDGMLQPWNYRWRVKDIFSHGDADRVYMG